MHPLLSKRVLSASFAGAIIVGAPSISLLAASAQEATPPAQDQPMQGQPAQGQPQQDQSSPDQSVQGQPNQDQSSPDQSTQGQPTQGQPTQDQSMQGQESAQGMPGDLTRDKDTAFKMAYTAPGTDWKKYKTIQLRALEVPIDVRDASGGQRTRNRESFVLGDKEIAALQQAYNETMRRVLGDAGYTFVDTPQADTLIVAPQVMRIRLSAPIERTRASYSGRGRSYSQGAGSITIGAVLADGGSSDVIGQVADHSIPSNLWRVNNSVTNLGDARTAFNRWARSLRDTLQK